MDGESRRELSVAQELCPPRLLGFNCLRAWFPLVRPPGTSLLGTSVCADLNRTETFHARQSHELQTSEEAGGEKLFIHPLLGDSLILT